MIKAEYGISYWEKKGYLTSIGSIVLSVGESEDSKQWNGP